MANEDEKKRAEVFRRPTYDIWRELVRLQTGGDRSFASAVQDSILTAPPEKQAALETRLLEVFKNKESTPAAREFVCRMLGVIGSEVCLETIAPLLDDPGTAHLARIALEPIPGEKVGAALRAALPRLSGPEKAGLIGTLGVRRDTGAAPLLEKIKNAPAEPALVREAAERALTRIQSSHV